MTYLIDRHKTYLILVFSKKKLEFNAFREPKKPITRALQQCQQLKNFGGASSKRVGRIYLLPPGLNRVNSLAKMPPPPSSGPQPLCTTLFSKTYCSNCQSGKFSKKPVLDAFALVISGGLATFALHFLKYGKVEKILKGSLDSIPSTSSSVKIQIIGWKLCLVTKF